MTERELTYPEALRQSRIARFDACPLSLKFDLTLDLRQLPGTMGTLGARGVLFHRFAAAAVIYMRRNDEPEIPAAKALEILTRVIAQREAPDDQSASGWAPLPDGDVVLLGVKELRWLRVLAVRWSYRTAFDIQQVVSVERRLAADIEVFGAGGERYLRTITGQPDVLMAGPGPEEATVIDWKSGFAPPSRKRTPTPENPAPEDKLSDMGYVQQVVYGWLVLHAYPSIQRVTLRENYIMADGDPVREATVERWEMERIEDVLAAVVSQIDAAIESNPALEEAQAKARAEGKPVPQGRWFPVPGTHCGTCSGVRLCPVRKRFGIPSTALEAQRLAREWHVGGEIRKDRAPLVKGWIAEHGPIPVAHAKGRRVVGYKNGSSSLSLFEPPDAPDSPLDPLLEAAARERGALVNNPGGAE